MAVSMLKQDTKDKRGLRVRPKLADWNTRFLDRITLGLMVPGLAAISIFQAMTALEGFEIPGVLGMPVGVHVFATKIYAILQIAQVLPSYGEANALGMLYLGSSRRP